MGLPVLKTWVRFRRLLRLFYFFFLFLERGWVTQKYFFEEDSLNLATFYTAVKQLRRLMLVVLDVVTCPEDKGSISKTPQTFFF